MGILKIRTKDLHLSIHSWLKDKKILFSFAAAQKSDYLYKITVENSCSRHCLTILEVEIIII